MPSVIGEGSSPDFVMVRTDDGRTVELPASLVPGFGIAPLQPAPDALLAPMSQRGPQVSAIPANEAQELWAENRPEPTGAPVNKRYDTPGPNGDPQPPSVWVADPPAPVPPSDPKYAFGQGAVTGSSPAPTAPQRSPGGSGGYGGSQDGSNPFARPTADAKSAMADTQAQLRANQRKQDSLTTHYAVDNAGRMAEIEKKQADVKIQSEKDMLGLQEDLATLRSQKIDPNRFWNNLGTPGKISAVIGLFIGGYNEAKTGKNSPLATVMKLIDNDIAAQKEDINNAFQGFNAKQGLYQLNLKRWGDEVTAMQATRLAYLDQYKTELAALQGQFKSTYDIGKIGVEMAKADMESAKMWEDLKNHRQQIAISRMNAATSAANAAEAQRHNRVQESLGFMNAGTNALGKTYSVLDDVIKAGQKDKALSVWDPTKNAPAVDSKGQPVKFNDPKLILKGTETLAARGQVDKRLREFLEAQVKFGDTFGGFSIGPFGANLGIQAKTGQVKDLGATKEYDYLRTLHSQLMLDLAKAEERGANFTEPEMELIRGLIGEGPSTLLTHDGRQRVARFISINASKGNAFARQATTSDWTPFDEDVNKVYRDFGVYNPNESSTDVYDRMLKAGGNKTGIK